LLDYYVLATFKTNTNFTDIFLKFKKEYGFTKDEFYSLEYEEFKAFIDDLEKVYKNRKDQNRKQQEQISKQKSQAKKYKR
jgi:sialic acid synthase SpsE